MIEYIFTTLNKHKIIAFTDVRNKKSIRVLERLDMRRSSISSVKDGYSFNFATNRTTGHYGNKNCSKLIWSAFKFKAKIDINKNGGLRVYPRDVRDSGYTKFVRENINSLSRE